MNPSTFRGGRGGTTEIDPDRRTPSDTRRMPARVWNSIIEMAHLRSKTIAFDQGRCSGEDEVVLLLDWYHLER